MGVNWHLPSVVEQWVTPKHHPRSNAASVNVALGTPTEEEGERCGQERLRPPQQKYVFLKKEVHLKKKNSNQFPQGEPPNLTFYIIMPGIHFFTSTLHFPLNNLLV